MTASSPQSQRVPLPLHPDVEPRAPQIPALPFPRNTFIGRDAEISTLRQLLTNPGVPLVTIIGPGGVGKTRLALHVAHLLKPDFAGGIAYVPLAAISDPSLVETTIAEHLGITASIGHSLRERLLEFFHHRQFLLVLDNVEHLAPAWPRFSELLQQAPDLTMLTTSRIRLGLAGEHLCPVPSLDSDAAMHLFHLHARAIDSSFTLVPQTESVVRQICDRIDRLPLAIELAASRTTIFTPQELLAQLETRLPTLTGGPRDAPPRSQDLRATIAWSYDLLPPGTQQLFRQLGVFVGGWTLQAARAVSGSPDDILPQVSSLVDNSLLVCIKTPGEETRFTMLETIREFALWQLEINAEEAAVRQAHATWFRHFAETLVPLFDGAEITQGIRKFEADLDNCRTALSWNLENNRAGESLRLAGALWHHLKYGPVIREHGRSDRYEEGRIWLEQAMTFRHDAPLAASTAAMTGYGFVLLMQGNLPEATAIATELLTLAIRENHAPGIFWAHYTLGEIAMGEGNFDEAASRFGLLASIAPALPDPDRHLAIANWAHAKPLSSSGQWSPAHALLQDALDRARHSGNPFLIGNVLDELTLLHRETGAWKEACDWLLQALHLYDPQWNTCLILNELVQAVQIAKAAGQPAIVARLLAATTVLSKPFDPWEDTTPALDYATSQLGPAAFEAAWQTGMSLTWHEILEEVAALSRMLHSRCSSTPEATFGLSPREHDVLRLVAQGQSNRAIAERLSLSVRTVENHMLHILTKLDLESRTAAAAFAIRNGLA